MRAYQIPCTYHADVVCIENMGGRGGARVTGQSYLSDQRCLPSTCGSSSPIKVDALWIGESHNRSIFLVIPARTALFRQSPIGFLYHGKENQSASRDRGSFLLLFYTPVRLCYGHQSPASLDSGLNDRADQCSTADRETFSTGEAASHVSGYRCHALVRWYIITFGDEATGHRNNT